MANQDCLASSTAQSRPCPEPSLAMSQQLAVQCMQVSVRPPAEPGPATGSKMHQKPQRHTLAHAHECYLRIVIVFHLKILGQASKLVIHALAHACRPSTRAIVEELLAGDKR